jgi:hypothetical protein
MMRKILSAIAGLCLIAKAAQADSAPQKFDNALQRPTREFVAFCGNPANALSCNSTITMLNIGANMVVKGYCGVGTRDMGLASQRIVHWLWQHPELSETRLADTYLAATSALWPC